MVIALSKEWFSYSVFWSQIEYYMFVNIGFVQSGYI